MSLKKHATFALRGVLKKIQDQIIEGLADSEIIEDLLQQSDLSLATTISKSEPKRLQNSSV